MKNHFCDIILPIAVKGMFTYSIPEGMSENILRGSRVLVQLGNKKLYSGIVFRIHNDHPSYTNIKPVLRVLDETPVVNEVQLKLWQWIADYYMCSIGEVMKAALPSDLCLEGVTEAPLPEKYKPREESFIQLVSDSSEKELNKILDELARFKAQYKTLTAYLGMSCYEEGKAAKPVKKSLLLKEPGTSPGAIAALQRKNIISVVSIETGRLEDIKIEPEPLKELSKAQETAYMTIKDLLEEKDIVLLNGITSSGKTEIYMHLIEEQLRQGRQVLYLLPEIALTSQIIHRLNRHFSSVAGIYHSRFNNAEKVEIWNRVSGVDKSKEYMLVLGVRSALFLPFSNLGLVIVDEEHDSSYKQHDPSPRYHARDSSVILASFHGAKTILGSASPSIESSYNSRNGKYGLVELKERYGPIRLPEIIIANSKEAYRKKLMISHFTPQLLEAIDEALEKKEQVILFQNRRGFSPYVECSECGWVPKCIQCAVSLTYHKGIGRMVCHYCGFSSPMPDRCGNCSSTGLVTRGFGTEKIEDEIKIVFPKAIVARMDQDTTKGKRSFERILKDLEGGKTDILIGTQMISKGLDIENLTVVGIMNADNLLNYPDFRAHERSFQLMEQVSGRAGRRQKTGKVIIQTSDPEHRIIRLVLHHDYNNMFRLQCEERKAFRYPPYCRLIKISLKHKERGLLNSFSDSLASDLRTMFGKNILGPEFPLISQIQNWYIKTILIKLDKDISTVRSKHLVSEAIEKLEKGKGTSGLRISVDVDPY